MEEHSIGFEIRILSNLLKRRMFGQLPTAHAEPPTEMHGRIIDYLYQNREQAIYQRDIEGRFGVRRSTASGILRLMEQKGIITREAVAEDARLKRLALTPDAAAIHETVEVRIAEEEAQMKKGISPEDLKIFFRVMEKIKENLA